MKETRVPSMVSMSRKAMLLLVMSVLGLMTRKPRKYTRM